MPGICAGRVVAITGAGRGIGREHAIAFAKQGAKVVVNDLGVGYDDYKPSKVADEVVAEIKAMGGDAVGHYEDCSAMSGGQSLVDTAVKTFGGLDTLVCNAGILRDRTLVNMTEAEWDAVIQVHMKGTFSPAHHAGAYWRNQSKAGQPVDARLINTASVSGIYGNVGQTNYGAAKAGIASFSIIASRELKRYGVTVNCIAPGALTRLTEDLQPGEITDEMRERQSPRWVAPIVTWLASRESSDVTGRIFESSGNVLAVAEGWHRGPQTEPIEDPTALGPIVRDLVSKARLNADMQGEDSDGGLG